MKKGTLYFTTACSPTGQDWMNVYEVDKLDANGINVKDGQGNWHWFPAHQIQRYSKA